MYLTKWNPFETISSLQDDIDNIFDTRFRPKNRKGGSFLTSDLESSWLPSVDIYDDKEALYFDVEVPGLDKDKIDIHVEDNVLSIKGEKKSESKTEDKNYFRVEREFGSFLRTFSLPDTADTGKIHADYKDGLLKIKIAKKEAAKPKKISVNVS